MVHAIIDITERKRAEEVLRQQSAAMTASIDGMAILDRNGAYVYMNDAHAKIYGYGDPEEILGKTWGTFYDQEQLGWFDRHTMPALQKDGHWRGEAIGKRRDGSAFPQELSVSTIKDGGFVCIVRDITERRKAEEARRQSEARFRRLVEQAAEAFFVHDLDGRLVEVNQQACDSLGYTKEELLTMSVADLEENFDAQGLAGIWEHIVSNGPITVEGVHRRKDGTRFPVEVRVGLFETGVDRLMLAMARDITARKARLKELSRLATFPELNPNPIIEMDLSGNLTYLNPVAERIFPDLRELGPEHPILAEVEDSIARLRASEEGSLVDETEVDGAFHQRVISYVSENDSVRLYVIDITERKQAEDALRSSEASLTEAQRIAHLGSWEAEPVKQEVSRVEHKMRWSDEMYRIFGFAPQQFVPTFRTLVEATQPQDREYVGKAVQGSVSRGESSLVIEHRVLRPDGEVRFIQARLEMVYGQNGELVRNFGTVLDITDRKRVEEELRQSESRLLAAQRIAQVGDWSFDVTGNKAYWSDEMYRIFGLSPQGETLTYKRFLRLVHPDDRATVQGMSREALKGKGQSSISYRVIRPDGRVRFVYSQYELRHDASGKTTELIGTLQDVTELRQAEEELRQSEERFRALVQNSLDVVTVVDANATVLYYSPSVETVMGYEPEEFVGKNALEVVPIHPDDLPHVRDVFSYLIENPGANCSMEMRMRHADGSWRIIEATANNLLDDPSVGGIVTNYRDITERKRSEEELRKSEATNRAILEATPDLMFRVSRDGEYLDFRANAGSRLYVPREEIVGSNLRETMPPDLVAPILHYIAKTLDTGEMQVFEYELPIADGALDFEARLVVSGEGEVLSIIRDVTERKVLERRLEHQAFHDALTGLPNRALFVDRLEHALIRASRPQESVAVLFLDLDNFKVVNDSLGHTAGDKLLVAVTERLLAVLRPEDTLARLGGDEFTILSEDVEVNSDVSEIAERVAEALRDPFILEGREVFVTTSIGIALGSFSQDQPGTLLRNADLAMYKAKETGKAHHEVFDPVMNTRAMERLRLEGELRRALERNEFRVYYQPKVLLETGKVIGAEALVRWEHPERGLLSPAAFIPLAEETGLIVPLGEWVLEEACRQAREWHDQHLTEPPLTVSVNLSARQFRHPLLFEEISSILESSGIEAGALILEITETVMMEGDEDLIDQLRELKASGVRLAIDDFGTGYSSLSYLSRFPVDYLKIDRSFIDGLGERPEARKLVGGIVDLASSLGLRVVAEGVETAEQLEELKEMGCEIGQGYYFARPLPAGDIPPLLQLSAPHSGIHKYRTSTS